MNHLKEGNGRRKNQTSKLMGYASQFKELDGDLYDIQEEQ